MPTAVDFTWRSRGVGEDKIYISSTSDKNYAFGLDKPYFFGVYSNDEEDGAVSDADFEGDSLKARARKAWAATPPVTQVYVGSSLALTLGSFFLAGNQWPSWLNLDWKKVMTGQLWFVDRRLFHMWRGR